jgi:hypothetical protein
MMRSKRAVRFFSDELAKATAAATAATSLVDRKRKAADAADEDFKTTSRMTRHCYGTGKSPSYYSCSPVYSELVGAADDADETQLQSPAEPPSAPEPPSAAPLPSTAAAAASSKSRRTPMAAKRLGIAPLRRLFARVRHLTSPFRHRTGRTSPLLPSHSPLRLPILQLLPPTAAEPSLSHVPPQLPQGRRPDLQPVEAPRRAAPAEIPPFPPTSSRQPRGRASSGACDLMKYFPSMSLRQLFVVAAAAEARGREGHKRLTGVLCPNY